MKELIGKFIGDNKIVTVVKSKSKTYLGNDRVKLKYESGKTEELPLKIVKRVANTKISDATVLREDKVIPIIEEILTLLVDSELTVDDISYAIGPKLTYSIQSSIERALEVHFGKDVRIGSFAGKVTLKDIDDILQNAKSKDKNKRATS